MSARDKATAEMAIHQQNLKIVMRCSNATPIQGFGGLGYTCYFCPVQFADPAHLKTHTIKHHPDLKHPLKTRPPYLNSYIVKLDITGLTCKICFETFDNLQPLIDHLRLEHNQPINTDVKNYMVPFRFGEEPLKCVFCNNESNNFRTALEHMNIHFRNHVCEVCDSGFVNRAAWRNHRFTHERGDHPCKLCPMVFDSALKLKNHTKGVHLKLKRNKCPHCHEKFNCLYAKDKHMERAHGVELPVAKCRACDRTFATFRNLMRHKKTYHLMEKTHKCVVCDKKFCNSSTLKEHMVMHTGARDFKCDVCHKAFGRRFTLQQHMRIHTNDRRYECEYCQSAFLQKCTLKSHLRSKHRTD